MARHTRTSQNGMRNGRESLSFTRKPERKWRRQEKSRMALIDPVKTACDRLAKLGWRDLLLRVTGDQLDIRQPHPGKQRAAVKTLLTVVDRGFTGFGDFAPDGKQGIT